jgi:hypothetical protein
MIGCSAVGVGNNHSPLGLGTFNLLNDREHSRDAGTRAGKQ